MHVLLQLFPLISSSDFEAVSDDDLAINDFFPISEEDERPKMKTGSNKRSTETWLDSDDVITLHGKQYYYYRIPHKVSMCIEY